jgi:hypothetical protein
VPSAFNPNDAFIAGIPSLQSLSVSIRCGTGRIVVYNGIPVTVRVEFEPVVITPVPTEVTVAVVGKPGPKTN